MCNQEGKGILENDDVLKNGVVNDFHSLARALFYVFVWLICIFIIHLFM